MTYVPLETRNELKQAAYKRYYDGLHKQDRPGWTGGKCPVTEYRGLLNEAGSGRFLGIPDSEQCWYSADSKDYTKPDAGVWEFKAGWGWTHSDLRKGVKYILWGTPVEAEDTFECGIATCGKGVHHRLSGEVEFRGWNHVDDPHYLMGGKFKPKAINSLDTIPWVVKA